MAKYNPNGPMAQDITSPPRFHVDVTPSSSVNFDKPIRSLWIGVGGDIEVVDQNDVVLIYTVPDAYELVGQWKRVNDTNTTAQQIRGWY